MSIFGWFRRKKQLQIDPPSAKRLTEHLWVKLVDLPGYREWAYDYDRLERIIPNLEDYHLLVLPADIKQPPTGYFEREFQRQMDGVYERVAHLGLPKHQIEDYRQGGKFFHNNV